VSKGSGSLQNSGDDEQSSIELISIDTPWILIELDLSGIITKISGQERAAELKSTTWIGKSYLEYLDNFLLDPYREQVRQQIIGVLNSAIKKIDFFAELKTNINEYKELLFQVERQDEYPDRIQILLSNINKNNFYRDKISDVKLRSMRVVEYGNIVILRADRDLKITDIIGNSELILGHKKRDLLKRRNVWLELFEKKEVRELFKNLREMGNKPTEISTEIALKKNKNLNSVRWLLLRAVPLFSYDNRFLGWEGFGIDITQKRNNEYELLRQKERIEALYEVAKELHEQNDSAFIALRGLQSLARATNACAGFVAFYQEERDLMEIVAAQGLKSIFLNKIQSFLYNSAKELNNSIQTPGLILEDFELSQDPFEKLIFAEGLTSALIAPLKSEDLNGKEITLGFIILFRSANNYFRDDDLDIVNIACNKLP
jgi:PAS domain-containing protein